MSLPESLDVALKEWDAVCSALLDGRQVLLLRKGGIFETSGVFEVECPQFLLFPTFLHQNPDMLKPAERGRYTAVEAEPQQIQLKGAAEVTDIVQLQSRAQMDALDEAHVWTPPLIDMRFNYRPQNPLYLLLVRAWRLGEPTTIENTPAYAGCKSWVPLDRGIATAGAQPVLDDEAYEARRQHIMQRLSSI